MGYLWVTDGPVRFVFFFGGGSGVIFGVFWGALADVSEWPHARFQPDTFPASYSYPHTLFARSLVRSLRDSSIRGDPQLPYSYTRLPHTLPPFSLARSLVRSLKVLSLRVLLRLCPFPVPPTSCPTCSGHARNAQILKVKVQNPATGVGFVSPPARGYRVSLWVTFWATVLGL